MIFADDWFDAVTAFETLYFWPDLPQAAVRGLQQAVLEETDGLGICAGERRLRQMARLRDDDCALRKRQARLSCPLASPFRTFPRGAISSMPLRAEGESKGRAFLGGVLSGVVEPIGAVLTILAALPYFLSFAAGAMLYKALAE